MRHRQPLALALLATLVLSGCGAHAALAPTARPAAPLATQGGSGYGGCYLSLKLAPSAALDRQAAQLRQSLGFLDMSQAEPPRNPREMHVTIGYFKKLSAQDANKLAARFKGQSATVTVDGYGVVNNQAAYFAVSGVDDDRRVLQGFKLPYEADDAHVTFGVCPRLPRDVHQVAKKAQQPLAPMTLQGAYHLVQGSREIW